MASHLEGEMTKNTTETEKGIGMIIIL
jgi:hypothetical protein